VEQVGCRIRPAETLDDKRNPFWYMPPPTYKCHWKGSGCQLTPCSRRNLFDQRVGLYNSTSWMGGGFSGVYNCQPMLAQDMSQKQHGTFENMVEPLQHETSAHLDSMHALAKRLESVCPWQWPTETNYLVTCKDGTECKARLSWHCCDDHKGIQRCPRNYPVMCNNGRCDEINGLCAEELGGIKPCPAAETCPWLVPNNKPAQVECEDDSFCDEAVEGWLGSYESCCAERGGLRRCPPELPIMCKERVCNDDFCCVTTLDDCKDKGGPRECNVTVVQPPSEQIAGSPDVGAGPGPGADPMSGSSHNELPADAENAGTA